MITINDVTVEPHADTRTVCVSVDDPFFAYLTPDQATSLAAALLMAAAEVTVDDKIKEFYRKAAHRDGDHSSCPRDCSCLLPEGVQS